jgi:hypothetical protein
MSAIPSAHPDLRRQLKLRLLDLSPRAFELFAGDLLVYVGLQNVAVTRYVGDGGIDAHGDIVTTSGIVRIPTGVQVKRHRHNVQRADIDRFIGALSGQYPQGIFITTARYAAQARTKASSSFPQVTPVDGDQVVGLMLQHQLGLTNTMNKSRVDEDYFTLFEERAVQRIGQISEQGEGYDVAPPASSEVILRPEDDLISLRALSYALHVDTTTVRSWITLGKLTPDTQSVNEGREGYFFRRDRIDDIRRELVRAPAPSNDAEWRQAFLDFAKSRRLTKSYKPVLLKALLKLVNRNGEVILDDLAQEFRSFYIQRQRKGLPTEFGESLLIDPAAADIDAVKQLIIKYPLDRFLIQGFLEYAADEGVVRFTPQLWHELRFYELLDVQASADEQLCYYYERNLQS